MRYKVMIVDDQPSRSKVYENMFGSDDSPSATFNPTYIYREDHYTSLVTNPMDCYIIDAFLELNGWEASNESRQRRLEALLSCMPKKSPLFLLSAQWGDPEILALLKSLKGALPDQVHFLAWSEFVQAEGSPDFHNVLEEKLKFVLERWHGKIAWTPAPNACIRILVLADLQYGDPKCTENASLVEPLIINALQKENLTPDLLLLAGDITYSGQPQEFYLAKHRIEKDLLEQMWRSLSPFERQERILLTPGNHDINLSFSACDQFKYDWKTNEFTQVEASVQPRVDGKMKQYFSNHSYAEEPFRRFAFELTGNRQWKDHASMSFIETRYLDWGLRFYLLNTVEKMTASAPKKASLSDDVIKSYCNEISTEGPTAYNIIISHHGPKVHSYLPDGAYLSEWEKISVQELFFDPLYLNAWIFGHYHRYDDCAYHEGPFSSRPLKMLQMPTLTMPPGGGTKRGFCVLELHRRQGEVLEVRPIFKFLAD